MKKRIARLVAIFLVVLVLNFFLPRIMPGDPLSFSHSGSGEITESFSAEQREMLEEYYGLNLSQKDQFVKYIKGVATLQLGDSISLKQSVSQIIVSRGAWTLFLTAVSLLLSTFIAISLSFFVRSEKKDRIAFKAMSAISDIPSFLVAIALLMLVGRNFHSIPISGNMSPFFQGTMLQKMWDTATHAFLPVLSLAIILSPEIYFVARSSMHSVMQKGYITWAKGNGLKSSIVNMRYLLKNAMPPITSKICLTFASGLSLCVVCETIFAYGGLGLTLKNAILQRDYPLVQGILLISCLVVLVCVFISETINEKNNGGKK